MECSVALPYPVLHAGALSEASCNHVAACDSAQGERIRGSVTKGDCLCCMSVVILQMEWSREAQDVLRCMQSMCTLHSGRPLGRDPRRLRALPLLPGLQCQLTLPPQSCLCFCLAPNTYLPALNCSFCNRHPRTWFLGIFLLGFSMQAAMVLEVAQRNPGKRHGVGRYPARPRTSSAGTAQHEPRPGGCRPSGLSFWALVHECGSDGLNCLHTCWWIGLHAVGR